MAFWVEDRMRRTLEFDGLCRLQRYSMPFATHSRILNHIPTHPFSLSFCLFFPLPAYPSNTPSPCTDDPLLFPYPSYSQPTSNPSAHLEPQTPTSPSPTQAASSPPPTSPHPPASASMLLAHVDETSACLPLAQLPNSTAGASPPPGLGVFFNSFPKNTR